MSEPLLEVENLKKHFPIHGGVLYRQLATVYAVDGVSLTVEKGETLGLVGESGCGKSTLGRTMLRLYDPTDGAVRFAGRSLGDLTRAELRAQRRDMQIIFQDPYESLNPRHSIGQILEEPFKLHTKLTPAERSEHVAELLRRVGLPEDAKSRYPHEFSGGQRQRVGIARAIATRPKLVVCDEPVSALDVSIQSQVLNLLVDLQEELDLTYVFIAHDLAVVKHISDRIAVMYLGRVVEVADADEIYESPAHPYTQALISAIPVPDPGRKGHRQVLRGELPSPLSPPPGCRFASRCPIAKDRCYVEEPELEPAGSARHQVACHFKTTYARRAAEK